MVAKTSKRVASDRLHAGWTELGEGRWDAARSLFEEALAREETPEAFEGLSWAVWWLDDAEAVFRARERAYRLYRKRGDAASAARMATWLAADPARSVLPKVVTQSLNPSVLGPGAACVQGERRLGRPSVESLHEDACGRLWQPAPAKAAGL